jgi:hypothetical protein
MSRGPLHLLKRTVPLSPFCFDHPPPPSPPCYEVNDIVVPGGEISQLRFSSGVGVTTQIMLGTSWYLSSARAPLHLPPPPARGSVAVSGSSSEYLQCTIYKQEYFKRIKHF